MFIKIVTVGLITTALAAQIAGASPFVEGNTPQKNETKPVTAGAPKPQLPTVPLPPLPGAHPGNTILPHKKRWEFTGKIDNRVIVTDTQTGEILSLAEGESLAGGCVASFDGVHCGKDATDKKRPSRIEPRTVDPARRLDELIFSAQSIAQKCIQLDDTLKSEIARSSLTLQGKEAELTQARQELNNQKQTLEQLETERTTLQEQLLKARAENTKYKDDTAFLLTTIALLQQQKGAAYRLPGAEGHIFKGTDGGTTILLNLKETTPATEPAPPADPAVPAADTINRRNK